MPRYDYNLVAIGAGAGGLVTTLIGAMVNAKVTLIEKHRMGGDCLNTGCVPSKSLIASSKVVQLLKKHEAFGLRNVSYKVDFPQVMEHIQGIIAKIAPHDSVERFTELGVECHLGEGREQAVEADHLLVATGRKANTAGFGLEELGVALNPNGTIKVDRFLRSSIPNVFACGDVASPYQFTHMAGHQAWFAAVNALFSPLKKFAVDYSVVPWCTYTDPEVARVGLSEEEALAQGVPHEVTRYGIDDLDRAITDRSDYGIVKVLTPPRKDRILGATICGAHAGDLLAEFVLAMKHDIGLNKILGTIHSYPTFAEANKFAAGVWRKHNAPKNVLNWLERFHTWRRR